MMLSLPIPPVARGVLLALVLPLLLPLLGSPLAAALPRLEGGVPVRNNGIPLEVGFQAAPCVVDWNEDGRKDLLVGQQYEGMIRLFLNVGTDLNPVFRGRKFVASSGVPITTSYL